MKFLFLPENFSRSENAPPFETRKIRHFEVERIFLENKKMVDHFLDSPPTGLLVGFFVSGADFEAKLGHLQCRRESTIFAFPFVFPMISRQILRGAEVAGFSIGEAKVGETHKKSDLLIFGIEKRDSPLVGKYVVIYSLSSH